MLNYLLEHLIRVLSYVSNDDSLETCAVWILIHSCMAYHDHGVCIIWYEDGMLEFN